MVAKLEGTKGGDEEYIEEIEGRVSHERFLLRGHSERSSFQVWRSHWYRYL